MMRYAHIVGWGRYLPDRVVSNDELSHLVDTTDEWIYQRTGIRTRHIAAPHETTATLAFEAAARALALADLHPSQVELIIVAARAVGAERRRHDAAGHAGAFQHHRPCAVAEEHTRATVAPVKHARHRLRADDDGIAYCAGSDGLRRHL